MQERKLNGQNGVLKKEGGEMIRQIGIGILIAVLGMALLPKLLAGNLLVLVLGIVLLIGIIALMVF